MPVLPTQNPTLADVAKRLDPDGKIAMIVEILNQTNEVLEGQCQRKTSLSDCRRLRSFQTCPLVTSLIATRIGCWPR